jgi:hypothetical protein
MQQIPYERLEKESKKAFEAFQMYRDMGADRSIRKVAKELGKSQQLLSRWSAQYDWVDRANKYDAEMDRIALLQQEKERKAMIKRHAKQSMIFQEQVLNRIKKFNVEELEPKDMIKWWTEAVKIERLSRGETTEKSEVAHSGEVKERIEHDISERIERYANVYEKLSQDRKDESDHEGDDT